LNYVQIGNEDTTFLQFKNKIHLRPQRENMRFFESEERFVTLRVQGHEVRYAQYCLCYKHAVHTITIVLRGLSTSKYVLREHLMCRSEIKTLNLPVCRTRTA